MRSLRHPVAALLGVAALGLAACGDDDGDAAAQAPAQQKQQHGGMQHGGGPKQMAGAMHTLYSGTKGGMDISVVAMPDERFYLVEGNRMVERKRLPGDAGHVMASLSDPVSRQRIPYASVQLRIERDGRRIADQRLWPMLARQAGMHYGDNIALPGPGRYEAQLTVGVPQVARHGELAKIWRKPMVVRFPLEWKTLR